MSALFFPNLNTLRLTLASGLVPPHISQSPVAAGFDAHGRLWLEPTELPSREALAALARIGVQALGDAGVATTPVFCWAALLPPQPIAAPPHGPILFVVPEKQLARFVSRLRRPDNRAVGVRLPDATPGYGWATTASPPANVMAEVAEADSHIEAFTEQVPGVWVKHGWRHPLPDRLAVPPGCVLLSRPTRSVVAVLGDVPRPDADEFHLSPLPSPRLRPTPPAPTIPVRVSLGPRPTPHRESLWVLDAAAEADFWAFCASADERILGNLTAATVGAGSETRLVVRATGKRSATFQPMLPAGYVTDPRSPGLFVPAAKVLRPTLRVRELAHAFGTAPGLLVWVEPSVDGSVIPHSVAESAFRPVSELIEYHAPACEPWECEPHSDPFSLARFVASEPLPEPELEPDLPEAEEIEEPATSPENAGEAGWFVRSLRKLTAKLRAARTDDDTTNPEPRNRVDAPTPSTTHRTERNVASPDSLLHGHDWAARRRELETRLFRDLPQLGPSGRTLRWADLAAVYTATGNAADAAVCWMNAVWETTTPPAEWLGHWLAAEARVAKLTDTPDGLERLLSEPARPGVGRVVAAYIALVGFAPTPSPNLVAELPRLLGVLDQHADDVPVRAAWLARLAAARICDGDALSLARWRDRLLARLAERGPALDLDEPSFLRFHGTASAERFQAAREWLVRMRKPALAWVQQHAGGKLRWAGIDAETECTAAYAQFMFAWGLGCLGERTQAKDWAARARKVVSRVADTRADPAAHAVLGDLFLLRVQAAQEGRPTKTGLPPELRTRIDALSEATLAQHAVGRLRECSRILEPYDRVRAFRGLDLKAFWGNDRLGERLFVLAGRTDPGQIAGEADDLLRLCRENPTTEVVPRVVLTLLELSPWLDRTALPVLLDLLPAAVDWTEAWMTAGRWGDADRSERLPRYQSRMLQAGFAALAGFDPPSGFPGELVRNLVTVGDRIRVPLLSASGQAFRSLRKLGDFGTAETLVRFLDPAQTCDGSDPAHVGLAGGWYAAGHDDAGTRILDAARDHLYLKSGAGHRARTPLAVAYAEALGFVPPRIGHGRLEEIFQRLGPVEVMGSTNSYFTLRPLQLVDAVVRAVVTDEFALGPAVRGWLDDDEFLIRGRIHRDLANILHEQDLG